MSSTGAVRSPRSIQVTLVRGRFAMRRHLLPGIVALFVLSAFLAGCGGGSLQVKAGPIVASGSSGTNGPSVLSTTASVQLSMMPTGDKLKAGVDWTANCGGNPISGGVTNGACGTLSPTHTGDGGKTTYTAPSMVPIGGSVLITAAVTSNPSQSSGLTYTIAPLPISVSLANPVPASVTVNGTLPFDVNISNNTSSGGVILTATCGSSACGSFNPPSPTSFGSLYSSVYTAPSIVPPNGAVTLTGTSAIDTTKSVSATILITQIPVVSISVTPGTVYTQMSGAAHSATLTAVVDNDPAAAGVDWSISCGAANCGGITPRHTASGVATTYSAPSTTPPGGTVTITAQSTTNPLLSAQATANIVVDSPIVVTMSSRPPLALTSGSQATLAAGVASDPNSLGVNWTATCGSADACGTFSISPAHTASGGQILYTAPSAVPAGNVVVITAASAAPASTPSNPAVAVTTITAQSPAVTITQQPASSLTASEQTTISAKVANDVAPGGVAWSLQCSSTAAGACGAITPGHSASGAAATYMAPPVRVAGTSVIIVATSVANPSISAQSNAIAIVPSTALSMSFVPSLPSQLQPNASLNLLAAAGNDTTNAGVDWQVCASGCGFFTVKPEIPAIPATATTPYVPVVPAVTATTVTGWQNGTPLPYTAPGQIPDTGSVTVLASAHADSSKVVSGNITISTASTGPELHGTVNAAIQPVVGSSVALYAVSTGGYGLQSDQLSSTVVTDKSGAFNIPGSYTCPSPESQVYLVALGGSMSANAANPNLGLMTALGACGNLSSSPVVVNEVTTVGSVYPLAPFASNDELTGNKSYFYIGSGSNSTGIQNAFAAVNNLVDISTGKARFLTPAGNAETPYVEINTLADALNACTSTAGGVEGDGSPCGTLFTATDTLGQNRIAFGGVGPADTLQAAFNVALVQGQPSLNTSTPNVVGYVFDASAFHKDLLISVDSPIQPVLPTAPHDWTLSLNFTCGGGLNQSSTVGSFAVDSGGNLWITDAKGSSVIEWNSVGAALSPASGFPAGGGPIAIDASGHIWISGNRQLEELTSLGMSLAGAPYEGVAGGGNDLAFDTQGNLWLASDVAVSEYSNLGVAISPPGGYIYSGTGLSGYTSIGVDRSDNVWVGVESINGIAELTTLGASLIQTGTPPTSTFAATPQFAPDASGDIWAFFGPSIFCKATPYAGVGSVLFLSGCFEEGAAQSASLPGASFTNGRGVALDGAGTVWLAGQGGTPSAGGGIAFPPGILPGTGSVNNLVSPSLAAGPLRMMIDGSGNVWILLADNSVTEYVGVATPVVTPLALGLSNGHLGAKP